MVALMGQASLAPISLLFFIEKHIACLRTVRYVLKRSPHQLRRYDEVYHLAASATLTCMLSCTNLDAAEPCTNWLHCLVQLYVLLCSATSTKNMAASCSLVSAYHYGCVSAEHACALSCCVPASCLTSAQ